MCEHKNSTVYDSRRRAFLMDKNTDSKIQYDYPGLLTSRRRRCLDCGYRFTTIEMPEDFIRQLITSAAINKDNILNGIVGILMAQPSRDSGE